VAADRHGRAAAYLNTALGAEEGITMDVLSRNWGWMVLRGVVAILFGILTLLMPGITLAVLVLMFGAYAFVDGLLMIGVAIARHDRGSRWFAMIIGGLLGIAAGLATFFWPGLTAVALLILIAVWAMVTGIAMIVAAFELRKVITGEWRLVLAGLLSLGFGVIMAVRPGAGALAMVLWIGAYAIAAGILTIGLGLRLRGWSRLHPAPQLSHTA
jgi:uncharacterized membrane protein HdeD (DUF308 family)